MQRQRVERLPMLKTKAARHHYDIKKLTLGGAFVKACVRKGAVVFSFDHSAFS